MYRIRPYWIERLEAARRKRPIVWLAGVRRAGKTTLASMLPGSLLVNCDLPSSVRRLDDPELFFGSLREGETVVLDEVHRLEDPSRTLKIAADAFPGVRVIATGSSTLDATRKFRDALVGRKTTVRLAPVLWSECADAFGIRDLDRRLLRGGLPEPLLADAYDPSFYAEWIDGFYARDIQELFGVRDRGGFLTLLRILLRQSGGLADQSELSRECGLSRPTVRAHLEALSIACAIRIVPPFHGGAKRELVKRPKIYGFDTGFVAYAAGIDSLRDSDRGPLFEHLVLDTLDTAAEPDRLGYWRDKAGREIDFTVRAGRAVHAIECKINPSRFDPAPLSAFRKLYPAGRNFVVHPGVSAPADRKCGDLVVRETGLRDLPAELSGAGAAPKGRAG